MLAWITLVALMFLQTMMALAAAPPKIEPLTFLLGKWTSAGTAQAGEPAGKTEFSLGLQDRVILRKNYADYPGSADKPGSRHEDLMVIYALQNGSIRADYYDSEGHVIRYIVTLPDPRHAVFLSDPEAGQPRFRLSYRLEATGVLKGVFDIAPAHEPQVFWPYLAWESRKEEQSEK